MPARFVPIIHGASVDRPDEADTLAVAETVAGALAAIGHRTEIVAVDLDLTVLDRLAARKPWAVFNLVESIRGRAALSHIVPAVLEHLGIAFTGAGAEAYLVTLSKLLTKQVLDREGIRTPAWWVQGAAVPAEQTVIVKSVWEHASWGMDPRSVVPGAAADAEIRAREARFGGRFFAERFVSGREFNVSLIAGAKGPEVLPVPEIDFDGLPPERPRIVDFEAKWIEDSPAYHTTPRRFGLDEHEPLLAGALKELALDCWRCFGLRGYARVDIRTDESGEPFVLEVNVNPCLAADAGFAATAAHAGLDYRAVIRRILAAARGVTRLAA